MAASLRDSRRLGSKAPTAITLTIQAAGTFDGLRCDTGLLSFALAQV